MKLPSWSLILSFMPRTRVPLAPSARLLPAAEGDERDQRPGPDRKGTKGEQPSLGRARLDLELVDCLNQAAPFLFEVS